MFKEFKDFPEPLQKKLLMQIGLSIISIMLFFVLWLTVKNIQVALPGLLLFVFFGVSAFTLFIKVASKSYIVISGLCKSVNLTAIKRHTKSIMFEADGKTIKIMIRQRLRKISQGMMLDIYVSKNTPIYETGSGLLLQTYLAIEEKAG